MCFILFFRVQWWTTLRLVQLSHVTPFMLDCFDTVVKNARSHLALSHPRKFLAEKKTAIRTGSITFSMMWSLKIIQRKLWTSISTRSTESNCFREHFISRHASWTTAYDSSRLSSEESYEGSMALLEQFITFPLPVWLFAAHMREVTVSVNV